MLLLLKLLPMHLQRNKLLKPPPLLKLLSKLLQNLLLSKLPQMPQHNKLQMLLPLLPLLPLLQTHKPPQMPLPPLPLPLLQHNKLRKMHRTKIRATKIKMVEEHKHKVVATIR